MDLRNPAALSAFLKGDLANALVAGTPGGIEAQEAVGQRTLTSNFTRLPKDYNVYPRAGFPTAMLERLGFKVGCEVDDIFVEVTPPSGWTLRPTDHSMHSDVIDDRGRRRAGVFYKAAFYDRNAHFYFATRYQVTTEYRDDPSGDWEKGEQRSVVKDGGTILHASEWCKNRDFKAHDLASANCTAWLTAAHPDWQNVEAYW